MGAARTETTAMTTPGTTLSVAQLLILSTAAQRPDRMVLPLPAQLRARGASQRSLLASLFKLLLVEELPTDDPALGWRHGDKDRHIALRLTDRGLTALGQPTAPAVSEPAAVATLGAPLGAPQGHPGGKLGQLLDAVGADTGASLTELVALTGWLPHTIRAALTRLRQRGYAVTLIQQGGHKAYRLAPAEAG
jgi:hypothetical protein